jgi:hypothetical protein
MARAYTYTYTPNKFAQKRLGISAGTYSGPSLTQLIMDAIGEDNYNEHIIAQDSFHDGKNTDYVSAIMNRAQMEKEFAKPLGTPMVTKPVFRSIGMIKRI